MIDVNKNTLLWVLAIVLIVTNELLTFFNTTYQSLSLGGKIMIIASDIGAGVIVSVILALLLNTIIAVVPYRELAFKSRFKNSMPIALIIIEIMFICFMH
jgi:hypothetical protein